MQVCACNTVGECQLVEYTVDFDSDGESGPLFVSLHARSVSGLWTRFHKEFVSTTVDDPPIIDAAVAVSSNAILLNWTAPVGSPSRYKTVVCRQVTSSVPCVDCYETSQDARTDGTLISGLEPYRVYVVQVLAVTGSALSGVSTAVEVRTKESG